MNNFHGFIIIVLLLVLAAILDKYLHGLMKRFSSKDEDLIEANKLYTCSSCSLYSRKYQRNMYAARHNKIACPHCEKETTFKRNNITDSWVDTHHHCPKIDNKGYREVLKTIKLLNKLREEEKEIIRFQEYNELKIEPYSWMKNLGLKSEEIEEDDNR